MISPNGDSTNMYIPPHPARTQSVDSSTMTWKITKFSGNALYWILQITMLILTVSFNILCNPLVWCVLKTVFNVLTEIFVYLVLGACSILISIITHVDEYYTKGRTQTRCQSNQESSTRNGLQVQNVTVKRFVDIPKEF